MATVKLDLISAKAQLASGKNNGKSSRDDSDLFTEVFSTTLSGSRTSTAVDDSATSANRDSLGSAEDTSQTTDKTDALDLKDVPDDIQELDENISEDADKISSMPAWLLMHPGQDVQVVDTQVVAVDVMAIDAAAIDQTTTPSKISEMIPTVSIEADVDIQSINGEQTAVVGEIVADTSEPVNAAGKTIIDSKFIQNTESVQNETGTAVQESVLMNSKTTVNIESAGNQQTFAVDVAEKSTVQEPMITEITTESETEDSLSSEPGQDIELSNRGNAAITEKQFGNGTAEDSEESGFAQMTRGEVPIQSEGSTPKTVNTETGMYSAEIEVSDVGQFGRQLIERIDLRQLDQSQQLTVKLRPDEFGSLTIRLTRSPEGLVAQLISDTAVTREILAQQANDLQQALKDQGFDIVQTEILSDFADQQQDSKNFDSWQQLQEGREFNIRTADAAARLSAQILEQDESQQRIERYTTGSVDYFA